MATGITVNDPALSWSASSDAATYNVQLSTASDFATTVLDQSGVTATTVQAGVLSENTPYYWRVQAVNVAGSSSWSTTWSFTTELPVPAVPALSSPLDLATAVTISPDLSWSAAAAATTYAVQLSTVSDFTTTVLDQSGLTTTTTGAGPLANNTIYYWRVQASNATGSSG